MTITTNLAICVLFGLASSLFSLTRDDSILSAIGRAFPSTRKSFFSYAPPFSMHNCADGSVFHCLQGVPVFNFLSLPASIATASYGPFALHSGPPLSTGQICRRSEQLRRTFDTRYTNETRFRVMDMVPLFSLPT